MSILLSIYFLVVGIIIGIEIQKDLQKIRLSQVKLPQLSFKIVSYTKDSSSSR